jgi:hypothetical protein
MNLDQTTLTHIAIGAVIVFLLLRYLGWQKPGGKPPTQGAVAFTPNPAPATAPPAGWYPPYYPPPPSNANAVTFDIPNLPVKAVITLQPEGGAK